MPEHMAEELDDDLLIQRARRGDAAARRTLYDRHSARVYAIVRRLAGDDDAADDCAQEAWVSAFRALDRFRGDARFSTWLYRIAVNSALQLQRRRKRVAERERPIPADFARSGRSDPDVLLRLRLERALDRLPDGMRTVLVLHDVEGYTHEGIGELLGISPGTSKSQLFKARARMREILRGRPERKQREESCTT